MEAPRVTEKQKLTRRIVLSEIISIFREISNVTEANIADAGLKWGIKRLKEKKPKTLEEALAIFSQYNLGDLKMNRDSKDILEFTGENLFESSTVQNSTTPVDHFARGFIIACLQYGNNKKYIVEEIKCVAKGDDRCQFFAELSLEEKFEDAFRWD